MYFTKYFVLIFCLSCVESTFWFKNDFDRVMSTYNNQLTRDYSPFLRALAIYKRRLQLLGFYPIVLNDDGLEYVSLDPYLIEDDYDDRMYELLKKVKKEKKSRKKLLKKKMKKTKEKGESVEMPTMPTTNIVYNWPIYNGPSNMYHQTSVYPSTMVTNVDKKFSEDLSEEDSKEIGDIRTNGNVYTGEDEKNLKNNENVKNVKNIELERKPKFENNDSKSENNWESERKPKFENNDSKSENNWELEKKPNFENKNESKKSSEDPLGENNLELEKNPEFEGDNDEKYPIIKHTSDDVGKNDTTTTSTTPYPLITVFPDPEEVAIEEILDQQEVLHKISNGRDNGSESSNKPSTISVLSEVEDDIELTTKSNFIEPIEDNLPKAVDEIQDEDKLQDTFPKSVKVFDLIESTITEDDNVGEKKSIVTDDSISTGIIDFFLDPVSENTDNSTDYSENPNINNFSSFTNHPDIFTEVPLTEINTILITTPTIEPEISTISNENNRNDTNSSINFATTEYSLTEDPSYKTIPDERGKTLEIQPSVEAIDPRSLFDGDLITQDVNNRRSDVGIETDDFDDEDTTDNLPYNLSAENKLELSEVVENTSTETSTLPPSTHGIDTDDNVLDSDIIPLIPIIINQMKRGNVNGEELEILKNSFGEFWPIIVEEVNREGDSSEEMNPILNEIMNASNRRVIKREATFGRYRRPVIRRRYYLDDDDVEIVRRRPVSRYQDRATLKLYFE